MNRADLSFLELMFQCSLSAIKHQIIIVNQSKTVVLKSDYSNIRVFNDSDFGLSRSRNLALSNCKSAFAWILDDDVQILPEAIGVIVEKLNTYKMVDLFVFKIVTPNGVDKRVYSKKDKLVTSKKELSHIHSIEMIFNTAMWRGKNFRFNTSFGLGAQFKMGEECIVSEDILSQNGTIMLVPEAIVVHDELSTANDPSSDEVIYARGAHAGRKNAITAFLYSFKYVFFLWRKDYERSLRVLWYKMKVFQKGANDYVSGFRRPRENDGKQ